MTFQVGDKLEVLEIGGIEESWHQVGSIVTVARMNRINQIDQLEENFGGIGYIYENDWYKPAGLYNSGKSYEDVLI